uniref:ATP synthase F0 subunit 8 n=1 Tax=Aphrodita australis TaxID=2715517 RepID=A0A6G7IXR7_9ANNE|nr:ATP synthase F0 subunit 8 [Aphrodita australis]QII43114.1 ATP synthase F0 subunit 8 [Aphrodita australis]
MPHLSPMNWILTPIVLWLTLMLYLSSSWWSQSFTFPSSNFYSPKATNWKW